MNRGRKDGVALKKRLKAVLEDLENQNRDDFSRTRASVLHIMVVLAVKSDK